MVHKDRFRLVTWASLSISVDSSDCNKRYNRSRYVGGWTPQVSVNRTIATLVALMRFGCHECELTIEMTAKD